MGQAGRGGQLLRQTIKETWLRSGRIVVKYLDIEAYYGLISGWAACCPYWTIPLYVIHHNPQNLQGANDFLLHFKLY